MAYIFVTLEVSKLSGWLNALAYCRVERRAHTVRDDVRAGMREAASDRGASRAQGRARLQIGGWAHGEERTWNMPYMVVTLEVSKLSGWLNADAPCRESKEGHTVRG